MKTELVHGNVNSPPRNRSEIRVEQVRNRPGPSQPLKRPKLDKGMIWTSRRGPTTLITMTIICHFHKKLGIQ